MESSTTNDLVAVREKDDDKSSAVAYATANNSSTHYRDSEELEIVHCMEARQAAQYGDLQHLMRLLNNGQVTADSVDSDDCSLLHWAAINNRIEVCELLNKNW